MMSDLLFYLPLDLFIDILSTWVDLRSLVRTVSACCKVDLHSTLTSTFKSPAFIFDHNYCSNKDNSFQWLFRYGIRSTGIIIDPVFSLADYMKYILKCGKFIKHIRFKCRDTTNPTFISLAALHCTNLLSLEFDGCCLLGFVEDVWKLARKSIDPPSAPILRMCSNLVHLNLPNCTTLSGMILLSLIKQCTNLRTLGLHNCRSITDEALAKAAQLCPHLVNLDISNCTRLTDAGAINAIESITALRILNCMGCNVTDSLLITISAKSATTITSLYLSGCIRITPNYINMALQFCSHIHTLSIDLHKPSFLQIVSLNWRLFAQITTLHVTCHHLHDRALLPIAQNCRQLQHLSVTFQNTSCVEGPQEVLLQCRNLRILVVGVEYCMMVPIWQAIRPDVIITHDMDKLRYNPFSTH